MTLNDKNSHLELVQISVIFFRCDAVQGQDAGTLYPGLEPDHELEIFIDLMCRTIKLRFEEVKSINLIITHTD